MERIKGLNEYVKNEKYSKALNIPNEQEEEYIMLAQGEYNKIRSGMNVMHCNCWKHREERQKCFM